jgi:hypothetical protein
MLGHLVSNTHAHTRAPRHPGWLARLRAFLRRL